MVVGIVWKYQYHKIAVSQRIDKYEKYNNPTHLIAVIVNFDHLKNTLIPIDKPVIKPKGKHIGKVKWGDNSDDYKGCFVESYGLRYFWNDE